MRCEQGILILEDGERDVLEADIGRTLTSCVVWDVLADLERAAVRRETQGNPIWASMIRRTIALIEATAAASWVALH